ncbi:MAG: zinc finger domain-containing protein [Dehalococcoidia bacterium]
MSQENKVKQGETNHNEGDFGLDMGRMIIPAQEIRCGGCQRFLGYQAIAWGAIKIKCPNCKRWTTLDVSPKK